MELLLPQVSGCVARIMKILRSWVLIPIAQPYPPLSSHQKKSLLFCHIYLLTQLTNYIFCKSGLRAVLKHSPQHQEYNSARNV